MRLISGRIVRLLPRDVAILLCLYRHRGETVSRATIKEAAWERNYSVASRVVDQHVYRLRSRLGPDGNCIETISCRGYRIATRRRKPLAGTEHAHAEDPSRPERYLAFGSGRIDLWNSGWNGNGYAESFTAREMRLLEYFTVHPDACVTVRRAGMVLGGSVDPHNRTRVRQIVCRLRDKLHHEAGRIQTVYGVGYRFMC